MFALRLLRAVAHSPAKSTLLGTYFLRPRIVRYSSFTSANLKSTHSVDKPQLAAGSVSLLSTSSSLIDGNRHMRALKTSNKFSELVSFARGALSASPPIDADFLSIVVYSAVDGHNKPCADLAIDLLAQFPSLGSARIWTALLSVLALLGSTAEVQAVFRLVPHRYRDAFMYNRFVLLFKGQPLDDQLRATFLELQERGFILSQPAIGQLLRCATLSQDFEFGSAVWNYVRGRITPEPLLLSTLMNFYAACGRPTLAHTVFDQLPVTSRDLVCYNILIASYASSVTATTVSVVNQLLEQLLSVCIPDTRTILALAKVALACADLVLAKRAWELAVQLKKHTDKRLVTTFVDLYGKIGLHEEAIRLFRSLPTAQRDIVAWNAYLGVFSCNETYSKKAARAVEEMMAGGAQPDAVTVMIMIKCATMSHDLALGQRAWSMAESGGWQSQIRIVNMMIDLYAKCGRFEDAAALFHQTPETSRDIFTWNAYIASRVAAPSPDVSGILDRMQASGVQSDIHTALAVLKVASHSVNVDLGRRAIVMFESSGSQEDFRYLVALLGFYGKCGQSEEAQRVRGLISEIPRDIRSWNSLLLACSSDSIVSARIPALFEQFLQSPSYGDVDIFTVLAVIKCAVVLIDRDLGEKAMREANKCGLGRDVRVLTAMIDLYGACGDCDAAKAVFEQIPSAQRDSIAWSAYLNAHACDTMFAAKAGIVLDQMLTANVRIDSVTILAILSCASKGANIHLGARAWELAGQIGCQTDHTVLTAMIYFYGRTARIEKAESVFATLSHYGSIEYGSLISAYAFRGMGQAALDLFRKAQQSGIECSPTLCVAVLQALSHKMMLEEARVLFVSLPEHIRHDRMVLTTFVDCCARAGSLEEAEGLLFTFIEPYLPAMMAVLGGCRKLNDVACAQRVFSRLQNSFPSDISALILMGNIYGRAGLTVERDQMIELMKSTKLKRIPGVTTTVINGESVQFYANSDESVHVDMPRIIAKMQEMYEKLIADGHQPDTSWVVRSDLLTEEARQGALSQHSERYALAYALLAAPAYEDLMLVQNIRICGDCHETTKRISKLYKRKIFLRDASRFHCFEDGVCDCGDHW